MSLDDNGSQATRGRRCPAAKTCTFRADEVAASQEFRKGYETQPNVVQAEDMPWEHSADGLIKHLVHQKLNTREMLRRGLHAVPQGRRDVRQASAHVGGAHLRGRRLGLRPALGHEVRLPRSVPVGMGGGAEGVRWKRGDYIYIPPFTNHQHVAGDHEECRLIVMSNRIVKEMGFDWFDQVENAPGF